MQRLVERKGIGILGAPGIGRQAAWWAMTAGAIAMAIVAFVQVGPLILALAVGKASPRELFNNYLLPYELSLHAMAGMLAILIGPLQMLPALRAARPVMHKWLGRIYACLVLISGGASLLLLPRTHSFGAGIAISVWGSLWLVCTVLGIIAIHWRDMVAHRRWMLRSYALTWSAVTIRLYYEPGSKLGFSLDYLYPASAVLAVVTNLLLVEVLLKWRPSDLSPMNSTISGRYKPSFASSRTIVSVGLLGLIVCGVTAGLFMRQWNLEAQARTEARLRSDLHLLKAALISYRDRNGHYPVHYAKASCEHPAHKSHYDELMGTLIEGGHLKNRLEAPARHAKGFGYCYWVVVENGRPIPLVWTALASSELSTAGEPGTCRPLEKWRLCSHSIANQDYCLCLP